MFCADYAASFIYHAVLSLGPAVVLTHPRVLRSGLKDVIDIEAWRERAFGVSCRILNLKTGSSVPRETAMPVAAGVVCGGVAAVTLYPFDFVRSGVMQPGLRRVISACATIPYAGTLFGVYFTCRDPDNIVSQTQCAFAASLGAITAEVPFDYAKRAMFGNLRMVLCAGLLYVPFAAMMLVMYDVTAMKILKPHLLKAQAAAEKTTSASVVHA